MAKTPPVSVPADEPSGEPVVAESVETPEPVGWANWKYDGTAGITFTNIPLTARPGDVVEFHTCPGVGWEQTDETPNRCPDNLPATDYAWFATRFGWTARQVDDIPPWMRPVVAGLLNTAPPPAGDES